MRPQPHSVQPDSSRRRPHRTRTWDVLTGFVLMLVPGAFAYLAFVLLPITLGVAQSLTNRRYLSSQFDFVGLDNYLKLLSDESFHRSILITFEMTVIVLVLPIVGGLAIAVLLDVNTLPYRIMRSLFFLPIVLSAVVVSFLWSVLLTDKGIINNVLAAIGLEGLQQSWLGNPTLAPLSVAVVTAWQMTGFTVTIFLASLQGVPEELKAASLLDGASRAQTFRYITWPLLAPGLTINAVLVLINALRMYDYSVVLTNGGPGTSSETMTMHVINTTFSNGNNALGSAQSVVVLLIIALLTVIALRWLQRREVQL